MLAQTLRLPGERGILMSGSWRYERKLDGLRVIAVRDGNRIELWSRNRLSFDRRFPDLRTELGSLPVGSFVIDGEVVVFDGDRTSFQALQGGGDRAAVLVAFDLLHLYGRDTVGLPLADRVALLHRALDLSDHPALRVAERLEGDPDDLMDEACRQGWEGLVAKKTTSTYRSGRSPDWRKLKCQSRQEFVIGGWTEPSGGRTGFGALIIGYYEKDRFLCAGRVGTGFDERTLRTLFGRLRSMETAASPFADVEREKGAHWVRPELVGEVAFSEWTRDGRLRHPSFLGLREDKSPTEVVREPPAR